MKSGERVEVKDRGSAEVKVTVFRFWEGRGGKSWGQGNGKSFG